MIFNAVITSWEVPSGATASDAGGGVVYGANLLAAGESTGAKAIPAVILDPSDRRVADAARAGVEIVRIVRFRWRAMTGAGITGVSDGVRLAFARLDNAGKPGTAETLRVVSWKQANCYAFGMSGGGNVVEVSLGR